MFLIREKCPSTHQRFHQQFTTTSPQKHHVLTRTFSRKPPAKTHLSTTAKKLHAIEPPKRTSPLVKSKEKAQAVLYLRCFHGTDSHTDRPSWQASWPYPSRRLHAQVFVVGEKSATADIATDFTPTHVPLPEGKARPSADAASSSAISRQSRALRTAPCP